MIFTICNDQCDLYDTALAHALLLGVCGICRDCDSCTKNSEWRKIGPTVRIDDLQIDHDPSVSDVFEVMRGAMPRGKKEGAIVATKMFLTVTRLG